MFFCYQVWHAAEECSLYCASE